MFNYSLFFTSRFCFQNSVCVVFCRSFIVTSFLRFLFLFQTSRSIFSHFILFLLIILSTFSCLTCLTAYSKFFHVCFKTICLHLIKPGAPTFDWRPRAPCIGPLCSHLLNGRGFAQLLFFRSHCLLWSTVLFFSSKIKPTLCGL